VGGARSLAPQSEEPSAAALAQDKETAMSRKQAKATARKPLGRLGVAIHTSVAGIPALDGAKKFYWFATEDYNYFRAVVGGKVNLPIQELHGPFDTREEAARDAEIALVGENCKIEHGGMWDPAWNEPQ
jgi:hypothetical protein